MSNQATNQQRCVCAFFGGKKKWPTHDKKTKLVVLKIKDANAYVRGKMMAKVEEG